LYFSLGYPSTAAEVSKAFGDETIYLAAAEEQKLAFIGLPSWREAPVFCYFSTHTGVRAGENQQGSPLTACLVYPELQ
jgi:hypothetical protein